MHRSRQTTPQHKRPSTPSDHTGSSSPTFIQAPRSSRPVRHESTHHEEEHIHYTFAKDSTEPAHGLRIALQDHDVYPKSRHTNTKSTPEIRGSRRPFLTPDSSRLSPWQSPYSSHGYFDGDHHPPAFMRSPSSFGADDDSTIALIAPSVGSPDPNTVPENIQQGPKLPKGKRKWNWFSIIILILSIYSTAFSAIFLVLATLNVHYSNINDNGQLSLSTASLLCAAFAKTIEISFVTVFVAALGQGLTDIAKRKRSKGISIADLLLRQWIQQPGSLITHWRSVSHATTYLAIATVAATVLSTLYTTASDALIAPTLRFGPVKSGMLHGEVKTMFANESYQEQNCHLPVTADEDPQSRGETCMVIEHAGQSLHNSMQFFAQWTEYTNRTPAGSAQMNERPLPVGMLWDNTTLRGQWVETHDVADKFVELNRLINNVTLAMPHAAVVNAARHRKNQILQPHDSQGLGEYKIHASVPSPSINVICAAVSDAELDPLVYTRWPGIDLSTEPNGSTWPIEFDDKIPHMPSFLNKTAVDDVFGWGERYGRRHPVFPLVPSAFATVLNLTDEMSPDGHHSDSVYVLATSNTTSSSQICSIRASMYPYCSTHYHVSNIGGNLTAQCDDPSNRMQYSISHPSAPLGLPDYNWTRVANKWAEALALGAGLNGDKAKNPRILTQLMLTSPSLNLIKPSIAEALAVQAGCTIINPALDSPLLPTWDQPSQTHLAASFWQSTNATIHSQEYYSGASQDWQGIFFIVLGGTLLLNLFCLGYLLVSQGLMTDFMEPHNLFALAVASPPDCSALDAVGREEKEMWPSRWRIEQRRGEARCFSRILERDARSRSGGWRSNIGVGDGV